MASAEKIVASVLLLAAETHAERGNREQVRDDNDQINGMNRHSLFVDATQKRTDTSTGTLAGALGQFYRARLLLRVEVDFALNFSRNRTHRETNLSAQIYYPFEMGYILGFDGGGTKTECVLMNSEEQVLARTFAGASNPSRIGVESAVRAIEEAAELALRDARLGRGAVAAVGGGGTRRPRTGKKEGRTDRLRKSVLRGAGNVLCDTRAPRSAPRAGARH